VILTDIVNTGMTLKPWVEEINRLNGLGKIMIFAVARMRNSPHSLCGVAVDCGVVIKRDYYPSDPVSAGYVWLASQDSCPVSRRFLDSPAGTTYSV